MFEAMKGAPASDHPHALRWYNHIKSFAAGMKQFPKAAKDAGDYVSGAAAAAAAGGAAAAKEEEEEVDLFGSGESMALLSLRDT